MSSPLKDKPVARQLAQKLKNNGLRQPDPLDECNRLFEAAGEGD
ncbi:MAG TPA: hypothetical protein VHY08_03870 [Bacillota bacterium]|nr:hypothetical protein [Bacillota bacterium]